MTILRPLSPWERAGVRSPDSPAERTIMNPSPGVALVTGSGKRRVGWHVAEALRGADIGWRFTIVDRRRKRLRPSTICTLAASKPKPSAPI